MQKYQDIRPFQFADLEGKNDKVSSSSFKPFAFDELNGEVVHSATASEEDLRRERSYAKSSNFQIDSAVQNSRGLARQEEQELEDRIEAEVSRRLQAAYEEAVTKGREEGMRQGREEALTQHQQELQQKIEEFSQVLVTLQQQCTSIIENERHQIYEFVKRFTKWIVMKEIDEKIYLEKLLEKLILELNARKNLIVKVGRDHFSAMPEVVSAVESRLGTLQNLRVEIVPEINYPGIILEAENGLIDGSLEGVFQNIDRIFAQVLGHE